MSCQELENWNPMAEDYNCPNFNSYNCAPLKALEEDQDPLSLYFRKVPLTFNQESFANLVSNNGELKTTRVTLCKPKDNLPQTYGFAHYTRHDDALHMLQKLHMKPPLNLIVLFAKKKPVTDAKEPFPNRSSREQLSTASVPADSSKNIAPVQKFDRGPGQKNSFFNQLGSLKIKLDGERRSIENVKQNGPSETVNKKSNLTLSKSSKLPPLESALCFCKKPGTLNCGICKTHYCSQTCQEVDWPQHESICQSIAVILKNVKRANDSSYVSDESNSDSDKQPGRSQQESKMANGGIPGGTHKPLLPGLGRGRSLNLQVDAKKPVQKEVVLIKSEDIKKNPLKISAVEQAYICTIISPSKFWLQLDSSRNILSEIQRELAANVKDVPSKCVPNCVYYVHQYGKFMRVTVMEVKGNSCVVSFLDHGGSHCVPLDQVYNLPRTCLKYPALATCCKLAEETKLSKTEWTADDTAKFKQLCLHKVFRVKPLYYQNDLFDVCLTNKEGISVYSILRADEQIVEIFEKVADNSSRFKIPSVWKNLKVGMQVTIAAVEFEEDKFWGVLDDGSGMQAVVSQLELVLQNLGTEERNNCTEEGDTCAALSPLYNEYYRCIVLKRLRDSFLVHYLDYGNKEEVKTLRSLPENLLKLQSFMVCCQKPPSMSSTDFKGAFAEGGKMANVKAVKNDVVQLFFDSQDVAVNCHPWYHGQAVAKPKSESSSPPKIVPPKPVMIGDIADKKFVAGSKLKVKVILMKGVSEMFVQLASDEGNVSSLCEEMNKLGRSRESKYIPMKNEVVCCKFSADNCWYRAEVIGKSKDQYRVVFLDFGNEDSVFANQLKPLPAEGAFKGERLGFYVTLRNLKNEHLKDIIPLILSEVWDMDVLQTSSSPIAVMLSKDGKSLVDLCRKSGHPKSSLKSIKFPSGKLEVVISSADDHQVYFHQVKDLPKIKEMNDKINAADRKVLASEPLLNRVYCSPFTDNSWYRVCTEEKLSQDTFKVNFIDYGNKENILSKDLRELPQDLLSYPVFSCPAIPVNATNADLKSDFVYHLEVVGNKNGVPEVKVLNFQVHPKLSSFQSLKLSNEINEVLVVHEESEIHYCQATRDIPRLAELGLKLEKWEKQLLTAAPSVDDVICAKSSDGAWYRASFKSAAPSGYEVYFIDYGNTEVIPLGNAACLPEDLQKFPLFCIPVRISNLKKAKNPLILNELYSVEASGLDPDKTQIVSLVLPKASELPEVASLRKPTLPNDKPVDVICCHIDGDIFYVQMLSDVDKAGEMAVKLGSADKFEDIPELPSVGSVVCARCSDGAWYRASVEAIVNNSCKVFFIDYGNFEDVPLGQMKILPSELLTIPVFSIPVKFKNVELEALQTRVTVKTIGIEDGIQVVQIVGPESSSPSITKVVGDSKDAVFPKVSTMGKNTLPLNTPVDVTLCHVDGDVYFIRMASDLTQIEELEKLLIASDNFESVSSLPAVGSVIGAKFSDGIWYRASVEKINRDSNSCKVCFIDYGNFEDVPMDQMKKLPPNVYSLPILATPIKFGTLLVDLQECMTVEAVSVIDGIQVVNAVVPSPETHAVEVTAHANKKITAPESLPSSASEKILLGEATQLEFSEGEQTIVIFSILEHLYVYCAPYSVDNISANYQLTANLTEFCNDSLCSSYNEDEIPEVAEMILAKFDGEWYRAIILEIDHPQYKVFFIDYGNEEFLQIDSIRKMERKFLTLPLQGKACKLAGFNIDDDKVSLASEIVKKDFTMYELKGSVSISDDLVSVSIPRITQCLLEKGIARPLES